MVGCSKRLPPEIKNRVAVPRCGIDDCLGNRRGDSPSDYAPLNERGFK